MPQELPKLDDLFFAVCRTAIQNTSWKYSEFQRVKLVEGQLDALEDYFSQPALTTESNEAEVEPNSETPEKLEEPVQISTKEPNVAKDTVPETPRVTEPPVAENQEKKN